MGLRCYPSIGAVGRPVDVALIAIPAHAVLPELERCASAGVKHAVIIASGFAEEGGASADIQASITALAQRTSMRISGPNAEGYYNATLQLACTFSPTLQKRPVHTQRISPKRVGIVAHSGGVGFALFQQGMRAGFEFSYVVTTGNEADLTMADFVEYMVADPHTHIVFLYCETIRDPERFERACLLARATGKFIVAIKVGQSTAGQRATASHTASMAGWNVAYTAFFERCGVFQASDMEEALAITALLVTGPLPRGKRVAVLTASGGAGAWASDTIERLGGAVPALSDALRSRIRALLPSYASDANPIDVTAQGARSGAMVTIAEMLSESDEVDAILFAHSLTISHFVLDGAALGRIAAAARKPLVFYSFSIPTELAITELAKAGIAVTTDLSATCSALLKLAEPQPSGYARPERRSAPQAVQEMLRSAAPILSEFEAKRVLASYRIQASTEKLAASEEAAVHAANAIAYPVALKVQSPDCPHKTEIGGVHLNVDSAQGVRAAYRALLTAMSTRAPNAQLSGVLVQRMAPRGYEVIVGTVRDATFGPLVMVGFGGVAVELYRDVIYRLAPVTAEGALDMLEHLQSYQLLRGFRGSAVLDTRPLAELIATLSHIAWELSDQIDELELNPVIVHADGSGYTIADALLRSRSPR